MHPFHLGIDVAKTKLDCALRTPEGKMRHKVVENTPAGFQALAAWLEKQGVSTLHVCMEATGTYRALRALALRLDALQAMHTQESNRLEVARSCVRDGILEHRAWLDQEIARLIAQIRDHIDADPSLRDKCRLLDSVPGLGERTIAVLLAFYGTTERFGNARQAAAFAGLDPRHHESGQTVKAKPHLSKIGHGFLRKALYMPAMVTLYRTAWGQIFRQRLCAAGKPPMLIIGAMMRKLVHVAFGVLNSGKPFDPTMHGA